MRFRRGRYRGGLDLADLRREKRELVVHDRVAPAGVAVKKEIKLVNFEKSEEPRKVNVCIFLARLDCCDSIWRKNVDLRFLIGRRERENKSLRSGSWLFS
jgi:hypothetical protein|tara:strand:- start:1213 stop:1512 length:300 start_codon:yes stop_codon:yes gene_type:complete